VPSGELGSSEVDEDAAPLDGRGRVGLETGRDLLLRFLRFAEPQMAQSQEVQRESVPGPEAKGLLEVLHGRDAVLLAEGPDPLGKGDLEGRELPRRCPKPARP